MPITNPFRNPFSGKGETPLIDFKHVSYDQLKKMTPEEIDNLDPSKVGNYQTKYYSDNTWGLSEEQKDALRNKIGEKIRDNRPYSVAQGGKRRKTRRRKGRKSRKHRKSRRSRK